MNDKPTILIAGATGNVGSGAAQSLAKRGARVVLLGRRLESLQSRTDGIRASLSASGTQPGDDAIHTVAVDLTAMTSVRTAAAQILNRYPAIDGLVLSAVVYLQNGPRILTNGHEAMFATNVLGPFLLTRLLLDRIQESSGMVLHVIAPFHKEIDWNDLESIQNHKTGIAYDRSKTCNRIIAAELARRYAGHITSVAFDPTFIIDRIRPRLRKRWPSGFTGFLWLLFAKLFARRPSVAGEPIAELMLSKQDRDKLNGAAFGSRSG